MLDTNVTEELEAEGWAADVIRGLQDARKNEGLDVSDRIEVTLTVPADKEEWANRHAEHIATETLATSFSVATAGSANEAGGEVGETVHDVVDRVTATVRKAG